MDFIKRLFVRASQQGDATSLNGNWEGHYQQYNVRFRIAAEIIQEGSTVSGRMRDLNNNTGRSLREFFMEAGLPPEAEARLEQDIRNMIPNASDEAIVVRSILPPFAILSGNIEGDRVIFTKVYQGESIQRYEIGDQAIAFSTPSHEIEYSGQLSNDRMKITGKWTIYQEDAPGGFIDGSFELSRIVSDRN